LSKIDFVNLHVHTNAGSIGDAIGFPKDIAERLMSQGVNVCAITDHGSGAAYSHAYLTRKDIQKQGKDFRFIYGIEAYFVDSLDDWHQKYAENQEAKLTEKKKRKKADDIVADADEASVAIEDEEETKSAKGQANPLNRRYHLVLLAKNEVGYKNLCRLISKSYERENYYRYPRIDYKMLQEHSEGLVCLSACMGSRLSRAILDGNLEDANNVVEKHKAIFGNNYFLEMQWNGLPEQHIINPTIISLAEKHNLKLVSTVDAHYPNPELWQTRELYKRLSRMSQGAKEIAPLPEKIEDMKYMLYPKTGEEMYADFKKYSAENNVEYDESKVLESFANTVYIANELISDYTIDTSVKFPSFVIDEGKTAIETLCARAEEGIKKLFNGKLNAEYQKRFEYELSVIEKKNFAEYFLLTQRIMTENNKRWLAGPSRGSAGGCLLSYLLEITQIDPIKYGLLFERFLDPDSDGYPDIDCLESTHLVSTPSGSLAISKLTTGSKVYDHLGNVRKVLHVQTRARKESEGVYNIYVKHRNTVGLIIASEDHRLLNQNGAEIFVRDLEVGNRVWSNLKEPIVVVQIEPNFDEKLFFTDITVEKTSTFVFYPFDVIILESDEGRFVSCVPIYNIDLDVEGIYNELQQNRFARVTEWCT